MTLLGHNTIVKRCCNYCADAVVIEVDCWPYFEGQCFCKHEKCPYVVLNKYKTYEDYLEAQKHKPLWSY